MSGPGRSYRTGISLQDLFRLFPDDEAAEAWFIKKRWLGGVVCPHCGSTNVQEGAKHPSMPFRCREKECGKRFSTKTGTVMEGSKLGYQTWLVAAYILSTSLKSVSSTKLARDLNITQRSAWFLAHRLRSALDIQYPQFEGPVEVDETYVGGCYKNKPKAVRDRMAFEFGWGGTVGKEPVVGVRDWATGRVAARAIEIPDRVTLEDHVIKYTAPGAMVYSDGASQYRRIPFDHQAVDHGEEYVRGDVRSIPAPAGEPCPFHRRRMIVKVYPRACGGTATSAAAAQLDSGLSPRLRGNHGRPAVRARRPGSIPAPAGEPASRHANHLGHRVYPRACGGTASTETVLLVHHGLSPRLRGNRVGRVSRRRGAGSIPAPAGEPAAADQSSSSWSVYPRACGGTE